MFFSLQFTCLNYNIHRVRFLDQVGIDFFALLRTPTKSVSIKASFITGMGIQVHPFSYNGVGPFYLCWSNLGKLSDKV